MSEQEETKAVLDYKIRAGHIVPCKGCGINIGAETEGQKCGMCLSETKAQRDAREIATKMLSKDKIVHGNQHKSWGVGKMKK